MDTDSKNISGIIMTIAFSIVFIFGSLMIIDRFTRKARNANEAVQIKEAETKAYLEKFTACQSNGGVWESSYCTGKK